MIISEKNLDSYIDYLHQNIKGKKIVFTNGCFDILHPSHIFYLQEAKEQGDFLIVAINSDESIKQLKGKDRPIFNQQDRAIILNSLNMVDLVIKFKGNTVHHLLRKIKPNIFVKGGDYTINTILEKPVLEEINCKAYFTRIFKDKSTTEIIKSIKNIK